VLKAILKLGVVHSYDMLEKRRIVFFNYLILFCIAIAFILSIATLYFGFITQLYTSIAGIVLFSLLLILNKRGHVSLSKNTFLILAASLLTVGTFVNLEKGYFVESENLLLPLMALTMFILDGKRKHLSFWIIFGVYLWLKILSLSLQALQDDFHFVLAVINSIIVGIVIYVFLLVFRTMLFRELYRNEQSERRLFSMVDNVPVFLALVDKEGRYILANENYASNFRVDRNKIIGKTRAEVLPEKVFEDQKPFFKLAQQGKSVSFLQDTKLPNGTTISANGKYEPIFDEEGKIEAITICVDDVTPLIKAQEALKVANETKDKLFSIIAHDIKSPLNMFQTFLNVSEQAQMSPKEFFGYQQTLQERLGSLTGTVDELLEWSRMQLGGINAYPEMVNVRDVVNENLDLFDSLIKKKNIAFKVKASRNVSAWIDENHFKVALRNLIHNAIKYTNGGGTVEVLSNQTEKGTIVRVADTGVGMASGTIDSIIKKRYKTHRPALKEKWEPVLG